MGDSSCRRSSKDIPIKIEGVTRYIKNVTKVTTCCDVIKMILKKMNIGKENLPYYTIFESANGVDRPLAGKTCILKTMRSWGSDTSYKLVMRKSAPAVTYITHLSDANRQKLSRWSKSSSSSFSEENDETDKEKDVMALKENVKKQRRKYLKDKYRINDRELSDKYRISDRELSRQLFSDDTSDSDSMDDFMSQVDSRKLTEFWDFCTAVTESEIKRLENKGLATHKISPNGVCASASRSSEVKFAVRKKLKKFERVDSLTASDGKQELMQKYFSDISAYETPKNGNMKRVTRRTEHTLSKKCNVRSTYTSSKAEPPCSTETNAFYWSVHAESASDETDIDSSLERAFVADCNISDDFNDSGITIRWYNRNNSDSNDNVQKLVDYSLSDDETDDSLMNTKGFDIRQFWSSGEVYDEDDAMDSFMKTKLSDDFSDEESFMKTKLRDDFSDEGLSSMASDEEKEILV